MLSVDPAYEAYVSEAGVDGEASLLCVLLSYKWRGSLAQDETVWSSSLWCKEE